jgi:hypothetical protein
MIAKPEKARQAEAMLVQMARTGQIGGRMSEDDLVSIIFNHKRNSLIDCRMAVFPFRSTFCNDLGQPQAVLPKSSSIGDVLLWTMMTVTEFGSSSMMTNVFFSFLLILVNRLDSA